MNYLLIGAVVAAFIGLSVTAEALPDLLTAAFTKDESGGYSKRQLIALGIVGVVVIGIVVWAIYHTLYELSNP